MEAAFAVALGAALAIISSYVLNRQSSRLEFRRSAADRLVESLVATIRALARYRRAELARTHQRDDARSLAARTARLECQECIAVVGILLGREDTSEHLNNFVHQIRQVSEQDDPIESIAMADSIMDDAIRYLMTLRAEIS
ncbi:hypothetical protein [Pseudactinotalea sp. HY158]|uniref:hypothetical protein n=1 Tax=Pseudactinotalea sp. HY158 TaxID=2654547 RepID=UPI00129C8BB1|nr:hypothetical protein [Pseudactinotalea sp. HY158]QGH68695.1 hypothetical protein GCE65_03665 [Pseudactinotalea sp. HY158]